MMLFDFGANLPALKDHIIAELTRFKTHYSYNSIYLKIYGYVSPEQVFASLVNFFNTYKLRTDYISFAKRLEKAQQDLTSIRNKIGFNPSKKQITTVIDNTNKEQLQFLIDAFAIPPVVTNINNNDSTIATILQHYYRRPGPQRVVEALYTQITSRYCIDI